ncbi:MAG TPA: fibronectin type III domain-containing protein [Phycisphaerales bacterium]|nr:fibronectin type III domain-containing protein [Phycisphaerales bacterium]
MSTNSIPPLSPRGPYLAWCGTHSTVFAANATSIGLTSAKATAYAALLTSANKAVSEMEEAKSKYRATVVNAAEAMRNLSKSVNGTAELVRTIRAFADGTANPTAVLDLAQLDPIAPAGPVAAPNPVTNVTVGIDTTNGNIVLRWKASQPGAGTIYIIKRRVDSAGPWLYVGSAGADKTFVDATFTPGPDSVQYSITAQRSNLSSVATAVVVNFGTGGNGQQNVQNVKLAA